MKSTRFLLLTIVALMTWDTGWAATLYHNFTQVDIDGRRLVPSAWLVVDGEMITEIGSGPLPKGFEGETVDMDGTYALPGLIDAHAHLTAGPHKVSVEDGVPLVTIESVDTITQYHALMALAWGVTSVKNPGSDPEASHRYDTNIKDGTWLGPRAVHAGSVIQPPPFGGGAFAYPATEAEWDAEAKRQADLGMRYFKLYTSLAPEELAAGVAAANRHGLTPIAHLDSVSWTTAAEIGVRGLEHALPTSSDLLPEETRADFDAMKLVGTQYMSEWFRLVDYDSPEMQELFETLRATGTTVTLTMLVNELVAYSDDVSVVIDKEAQRATHPASWDASAAFLRMGAANWTVDDYQAAREALSKVREFARLLFEKEVPLLIGTDSNSGGPQMALEMQYHVDAGIPVYDVLDLATHRAADTIGIANTGRLVAEYEADVVFVRSNPVDDVRNVADVESVLVDGRFFVHEELIEKAEALLEVTVQ